MSIYGLGMVGGDTVSSVSRVDTLGKDDFLTLLVAQLKNQDPLEPMESTEFTTQLAQFSSLEQLGNIYEDLEYMKLYQASLNNSQAVNLVGKAIEASANSIRLENGVTKDIWFELEEDADAVFVNIYDSSETLVKTIEAEDLGAGRQSITWDGTNNTQSLLPAGSYFFEVQAFDPQGNAVDTSALMTGKVTGVSFTQEGTYLKVGDQEVLIGDVISVSESGE